MKQATKESFGREKRLMRRFPIALPVTINGDGGVAQARTRDISSHGICFYCDAALQRGSKIDFTLTLPTEVTLTEPLRVRCSGRVVRVEGGGEAGSQFAIAAAIENYEFVNSDDEMLNLEMCADERPTV